MTQLTRRSAMIGTLALAGCASRVTSSRGEIDTRVGEALAELYDTVPGAREISGQAAGVLIMPRVNEGSLVYGASYGEGSLMIGGAPVDYYSMASASLGFQIGAQRYRHALFFMTPETLADFRTADGWELGLDAEYAIPNRAGAASITSSTYNKPIYAVIYGQEGIIVGASLEGNKYSRIVR